MPKTPIPPKLEEFLRQPNPAVIGSVRPDGSSHTAATWYVWDDGRVLVNMEDGRKRLDYMRDKPSVSITVLGQDDWYRQVTLRGRITLEDDSDFEGVDRVSRHYLGAPYGHRDRGRVNGWIEVESWYGWSAGRPWDGSD